MTAYLHSLTTFQYVAVAVALVVLALAFVVFVKAHLEAHGRTEDRVITDRERREAMKLVNHKYELDEPRTHWWRSTEQ